MISDKEFLVMVEKAKLVVKDVGDEYREAAFQTYLMHLIGGESLPKLSREVFTQLPPSVIPPELIARINEISSRDVILLMLRYEKSPMTREEMTFKSAELGKPLSTAWMSDNFAAKTRGFLVEVKQGEKTAYKMSAKGALDFDARVKELLNK